MWTQLYCLFVQLEQSNLNKTMLVTTFQHSINKQLNKYSTLNDFVLKLQNPCWQQCVLC